MKVYILKRVLGNARMSQPTSLLLSSSLAGRSCDELRAHMYSVKRFHGGRARTKSVSSARAAQKSYEHLLFIQTSIGVEVLGLLL